MIPGQAEITGHRPRISRTIIVEGRDDMSAVLAAVDANVIWTNGYGIRQQTLDLIEEAARRTGIIIFTDPDHAGRQIRERLTKLFPGAGQAYLTRSQAEKDGDIGIENASPASILAALDAAAGTEGCPSDRQPVTMQDMFDLGLAGAEDSAGKRAAAGSRLGIGTANSKTFLKRINYLGISFEDLRRSVTE